jgi:hypothetical protein
MYPADQCAEQQYKEPKTIEFVDIRAIQRGNQGREPTCCGNLLSARGHAALVINPVCNNAQEESLFQALEGLGCIDETIKKIWGPKEEGARTHTGKYGWTFQGCN